MPGLQAGNLRVTADLLLNDGFIELAAPDGYALLAGRLHVGGEFYLRRLRCQGTIRLNDAEVGATLDCTGARLERPRRRPDGSVRPSLDARAATIGKDLLCRDGFVAARGARLRRAEARKSVQFVDATLVGARAPATPGTRSTRTAW
jgi:hypothetical protein